MDMSSPLCLALFAEHFWVKMKLFRRNLLEGRGQVTSWTPLKLIKTNPTQRTISKRVQTFFLWIFGKLPENDDFWTFEKKVFVSLYVMNFKKLPKFFQDFLFHLKSLWKLVSFKPSITPIPFILFSIFCLNEKNLVSDECSKKTKLLQFNREKRNHHSPLIS